MEKELKELHCKACVAHSIRFVVDDTTEESFNLKEHDNFSTNLATILARDKEVVAVRLVHRPNNCDVYLAKNKGWSDEDIDYINEIKKYVKSLSKDAPMKFADISKRDELKKFFERVLAYCSTKITSRFDKLKRDIENDLIYNNQAPHIRIFVDYARIDTKKINEANGFDLSPICSNFYKKFKNDPSIPAKFLRHIRKVGSYYTAMIDITACACKDKYKLQFSNIRVRRIAPVSINQFVFSWKDTVQRYIPDHEQYEEFKKRCLSDNKILENITKVYRGVDKLDNENRQTMYLHAEMNLVKNIVDHHNKDRVIFIAVSKRSCYLCESYIRFINSKGYKIYTFGAHKKLYSRWLLPDLNDTDLKNESLKYMIKQLDHVINNEIAKHVSIVARSDCDGESVKIDEDDENSLDAVLDVFLASNPLRKNFS